MITAQKVSSQKPLAVVAGGAGFLGSFLCEILLLQDCRVVCLDNLSRGKKENLSRCFANKDFIFVNRDLTKPFTQKFNEPISYIFDFVGLEDTTKNLCQLAVETGAKLLVVLGDDSQRTGLHCDIRFVHLIDVYGPRMNLQQESPLIQLIKAAVDGKVLPVPGGGVTKARPLFVSDAVYGLIKVMFGVGTEGGFFNLISPKEETLLSFAQELQKQSTSNLKIEFLAEEKHSSALFKDYPRENRLSWKPKVDLKEGIGQTLKFFEKKTPRTVVEPQPIRQIKKPWFAAKRIALILFAIFLVFLAPFLSLSWEVFWGVKNFQKAQQAFISADFDKASASAKKAGEFFKRAESKTMVLKITTPATRYFRLGKELAYALINGSVVGERAERLIDGVFQEGDSDLINLCSEIKVSLDDAYYHLSLIDGEFKNVERLKTFRDQLPELRNSVLQARQTVQIFPSLVGVEEKKTYLVLFQNNNELRPTGGFIGSFALVTFEKGKLLDFEVQDVYWADGQLKGHVEPPPELKKYLGEANWYLRDANWSPDFPTSAAQTRWFLEKEIGRVVDGVIGVNLFLAQRLLEATGEIELPDYKEKINTTNLFERAQYYSEIGFFPGSTQKQDFLGSLARTLFEKLKKTEGRTRLALAQAIYQSLNTKDLLVFFSDAQTMRVITDLGWDGRVKEITCSETVCYADYLMIVEANVGVNKANFFVQREINHEVNIDSNGGIKEKLKITYQNASPSENFPAGRYKNYLRILVPEETQLEMITLDGVEVRQDRIDKRVIAGKTSFGFLIEVPIKEKRAVEISYRLPGKIQLAEKSQYLLFLQKQSGAKEEKFNLKLTPPAGMVVLSAKPAAIAKEGGYFFDPQFDQDIVFEIDLVK